MAFNATTEPQQLSVAEPCHHSQPPPHLCLGADIWLYFLQICLGIYLPAPPESEFLLSPLRLLPPRLSSFLLLFLLVASSVRLFSRLFPPLPLLPSQHSTASDSVLATAETCSPFSQLSQGSIPAATTVATMADSSDITSISAALSGKPRQPHISFSQSPGLPGKPQQQQQLTQKPLLDVCQATNLYRRFIIKQAKACLGDKTCLDDDAASQRSNLNAVLINLLKFADKNPSAEQDGIKWLPVRLADKDLSAYLPGQHTGLDQLQQKLNSLRLDLAGIGFIGHPGDSKEAKLDAASAFIKFLCQVASAEVAGSDTSKDFGDHILLDPANRDIFQQLKAL